MEGNSVRCAMDDEQIEPDEEIEGLVQRTIDRLMALGKKLKVSSSRSQAPPPLT